jgi:hypothetical protein
MATALSPVSPLSPLSPLTTEPTPLTFDLSSSELTQNQFRLPNKFLQLVQLTTNTNSNLDKTTILLLQSELETYLRKHPEVLPLLLKSHPHIAKPAHNFLNKIKRHKELQLCKTRFRYYYPSLKLIRTPSNDKEVAYQTPTPQHKGSSLNNP